MGKFESLSHTTWECKYHVVFIPECRRKVLYGQLRFHLGEVFRKLAGQKEGRVEEGHLMPDHVHMLLSIPPNGSYADKTSRLVALATSICDVLGCEAPQAAAGGPSAQGGPDNRDGQGVHLPPGDHGRHLRPRGGAARGGLAGGLRPVHAGLHEDRIPRSRIGQVVGLANRMDTLVGIFGLGLIPTGSRDPFGLRRAAQGAVRIALEGGLPLDLEEVAARAAVLYGDRLTRSAEQILDDLRPFLHDRVRYVLGLAGYAYDEIEAALAAGGDIGGSLPDLRRGWTPFTQGRTRGAARRAVPHSTGRARPLRRLPGSALGGGGGRLGGRL